MDLRCPHCVQQVSIPSERAGQVVACPLCGKPFMAPALSPMPSLPPNPPPAPPPPPAPETYGVTATAPAAVPPAPAPAQPEAIKEGPPPPSPPKPPPPPGEYTRRLTLTLRPEVVGLVPAFCLGAVFVLSFMTWYHVGDVLSASLWQLAFTGLSPWGLTGYTLSTLLALPLSAALLVLSLLLFPLPPAVTNFLPWGWIALTALLLLGALFLGLDYFFKTFVNSVNPIAPAMKLAARLHLLALVASAVQFWLGLRAKRNLPPPYVELRA